MKFLWLVLLSGLSLSAVAQAEDADEGGPDGPPRGWQLGVAAVVSDSPYAGEGTRVIPIPLIGYQGERFHFRGISAGWTVLELGSFEMSAVAKARLDGFKVDDLGRAALARNGLDYRLLEDRKNGVDVGLGLKWRGRAGELEAELLADVADRSGGQEVSLEYGYPFEFGQSTLTPKVGVTWQSKDMADYYYGTLPEEAARGAIDYRPGAVTVPHVGVTFLRPLGEKWMMLGNIKYSILPDEIRDSPFVEPDTDATTSLFVGFSRAF
ncbi:MipA/OmpV family protein [Tahibacter caeni]|uniref:MipA/OmpV family protein n=1 Tax=Tahibacter caeni TaxID=1453545 RepID=UPI00214832D4|nr:MipA/OmpV family protein [Tahibacter caeni]